MWQRHTQPSAFSGTRPMQRRRLRVVDEAHVPAAGELARVHLVVAPPGLPLLLVEILGRALQRVVHQLGRVEELLAPVDHLPLAVEPDVAHQRHERVEDLRDAAAERGRGDVHHPLALQRLGQLADFGDQLPPADVRVVGERLVAYGDGLEHAAARYLTACASSSTHRALRSDRAGIELWSTADAQRTPLPRGLRALRVRAGDRRVLADEPPAAAQLDARARRVRRRARARRN